jgi:hypothetical protein
VAAVTLDLTEHDFERLSERSWTWDSHWEEQYGLFENFTPGKGPGDDYSYGWKYAYEVGYTWVGVILATAFLRASGFEHEVLWNTEQLTYLVLTNYETTSWRTTREREQRGG